MKQRLFKSFIFFICLHAQLNCHTASAEDSYWNRIRRFFGWEGNGASEMTDFDRQLLETLAALPSSSTTAQSASAQVLPQAKSAVSGVLASPASSGQAQSAVSGAVAASASGRTLSQGHIVLAPSASVQVLPQAKGTVSRAVVAPASAQVSSQAKVAASGVLVLPVSEQAQSAVSGAVAPDAPRQALPKAKSAENKKTTLAEELEKDCDCGDCDSWLDACFGS